MFGSDLKQGFDQTLDAKLHKASEILWQTWAKDRREKRWNLGKTGAQSYWSFNSKITSERKKKAICGSNPIEVISLQWNTKAVKKLQSNSIGINYLFNLKANVTFPFKMNFSLKVRGAIYYFKWKKIRAYKGEKCFVFFFLLPPFFFSFRWIINILFNWIWFVNPNEKSQMV